MKKTLTPPPWKPLTSEQVKGLSCNEIDEAFQRLNQHVAQTESEDGQSETSPLCINSGETKLPQYQTYKNTHRLKQKSEADEIDTDLGCCIIM